MLADVSQPGRFTSEIESFQISLKARASVYFSQARILKWIKMTRKNITPYSLQSIKA